MGQAVEIQPFELSEPEAAKLLGIKRDTLQTWRYLGKAPPHWKHLNTIRYSAADLLAWQQARIVRPA